MSKITEAIVETKHNTPIHEDINAFLNEVFCLYLNPLDFSRPHIIEVFPSHAEKLLRLNKKNRPLRKAHVNWLAKQMELGYWVFTGQVIGIDVNGYLINLQHTLNAVIKSQTSQNFIVLSGLDERAIEVMDTGISRTAGDVLNMNGIPNGNVLAGTARKIIRHKNNTSVTLTRGGGTSGAKFISDDADLITNTTILEMISSNIDFWIEHARETLSFYRSYPVMGPTDYGFLYFICREKNHDAAWEFFSKLTTGVGLKKDTPVYVLRQKFEKETMSKLDHSPREKMYWIRYCWNKFREGAQMKIITGYNPELPLPEFI